MKPLYTFLTVVALVWASQAQAQFQNILVGNMNSPQEPSIMINPKNVAQMVAGANMNNVYVSTDTGNTWQHQILSSTYGVQYSPGVCDPWT